MILNYLYWL